MMVNPVTCIFSLLGITRLMMLLMCTFWGLYSNTLSNTLRASRTMQLRFFFTVEILLNNAFNWKAATTIITLFGICSIYSKKKYKSFHVKNILFQKFAQWCAAPVQKSKTQIAWKTSKLCSSKPHKKKHVKKNNNKTMKYIIICWQNLSGRVQE